MKSKLDKPTNTYPKIKDLKIAGHITLTNAGIRKDVGIIEWPGNPIDGKPICIEVFTKGKKVSGWGKGEVTYYLGEDKSPEFKTVQDFINHYSIKVPEPTKVSETIVRVKIKPEALARRNKN